MAILRDFLVSAEPTLHCWILLVNSGSGSMSRSRDIPVIFHCIPTREMNPFRNVNGKTTDMYWSTLW